MLRGGAREVRGGIGAGRGDLKRAFEGEERGKGGGGREKRGDGGEEARRRLCT